MKILLQFNQGQKESTIDVTDKLMGFLISYEPLLFDDVPFKQIRNRFEVLQRIQRVAMELGVSPSKFVVEFTYDVGTAQCAVDENRTLLLSLPIFVRNKKIIINNSDMRENEDYLLYHELMHSKEVLDGRFPSIGRIGPNDCVDNLIGRLNDFANEGRLEAMEKPHQPKDLAIENVYECIQEDCYVSGTIPQEVAAQLTIDEVRKLCVKVWGKDDLTRPEATADFKRSDKVLNGLTASKQLLLINPKS